MESFDLDEAFVIDSAPSDRFPIYTRANAVDVWPGTISPLNATTQTDPDVFDAAWRRALVRFGAFTPDEFDEKNPAVMGFFYGYFYLNLSLQRVLGVRMPGLDADTMTTAFLGSSEGVPPYEPDPRDESESRSAAIGETIGWILGAESLPDLEAQRADVEALRAQQPDLSALSDRELVEYALPLITDHFGSIIEEHLFITTTGSIPIGIVQSTAAALGDPCLALRALSGLGGVDSAAPSFEMWELGRLVAASPALTAIFDAGCEGIEERLRSGSGPEVEEFVRRFDDFLSRFGSRCSNEWDLGELDWISRPQTPLTMIGRMRLQSDAASPMTGSERLAADREAVTRDILARLEGDDAAVATFTAAVKAASVFLPARERTKATCVLLLQPARHAFQELGRRMVAAGHCDAIDDFTMLRKDELVPWVEDPGSYQAEISRRRAWTAALDALEPPFLTVGAPSPPSTWRRREIEELPPVQAGEIIAGSPGCQGVATGIARVIRNPMEGDDLQPGDVLIAEATDPGWTPLFVSAAAVVVDTGAALSHAAIVSRELGVPCVVSAAHASRRIPNGARITVDGTTGTVTVLSV